MRSTPSRIMLASALLACGACSSRPTQTIAQRPCPSEAPAPPVLPGQRPLHNVAEYWLQRMPAPDDVLLGNEEIAEHNRQVQALRHGDVPIGRWDLRDPALAREPVQVELQAKLQRLWQAVMQQQRVAADGERPLRLLEQLARAIAAVEPVDEFRLVHVTAPLRCHPTDQGLYDAPWQLAFDLLQCAQLRPGELVRVRAKGRDFWYVWSSYASGWVRPAALTPPLNAQQLETQLAPARSVSIQRDQLAVWADADGKRLLNVVRLGALFPLLGHEPNGALRISAPSPTGPVEAWVLEPGAVSLGYPPFTRRNLFARAFTLLDTPYGWGGVGGHRDCSRLVMDLFASFGILLPRNSSSQALSGTRRLDVGDLDVRAKATAITAAAERAVVLLYLPGHIMLYVGREGDQLYALHQFSGYLEPCPQGGETMLRANRAVVSSLALGRGSSRRSFLERITRLVLFERAVPREAH